MPHICLIPRRSLLSLWKIERRDGGHGSQSIDPIKLDTGDRGMNGDWEDELKEEGLNMIIGGGWDSARTGVLENIIRFLKNVFAFAR